MLRPFVLATVLSATPALAEVPKVATDILPIQSLAARVMADIGTPALIVPPGASPHGYAMRPSEARDLDQAELVFWVGEGLTPWMEKPLETLAGDATVIELVAVPGTQLLEFREGATFEKHDHDHDDHAHEDHHEGEEHADEHHDHDHHEGEEHADEHHDEDHHEGEEHADEHHDDDHHEGEEHADAHHDEDGHHGHDENDPHAWLDPENGKVWLTAIAEALATADPQNAEAYRANAAAGVAEIDETIAKVAALVDPVHEAPFIVFHDAYQYFETRFGLAAAGSIRLGDASDPSPARIAEIREKVQEIQARCVFSEPQFNSDLVDTVFEGTEVNTAVLDPLGTMVSPGPHHYTETLEALGRSIATCLK